MKKSFKVKSVALSLLFAISSLGWTQSNAPQQPEVEIDNPSIIGEAGRAVFGRVFGFQDQGGEIDYYAYDLSKRNRTNATVRSVFIPGWGQAFNGQRTKGIALFVTASVALTGAIVMHNKSGDSFDDYEAGGRLENSLFDDYERERVQSIILGSIAGLLWGYSILDAYRNAYNPLWGKDNSVELSYLPDHLQLKFNRRF